MAGAVSNTAATIESGRDLGDRRRQHRQRPGGRPPQPPVRRHGRRHDRRLPA
ncbi:MAG: hypothetical protein MZW92_13645 [Comamonadaceae bacterium]|nr:hypothetical protein [Comamonadaceae bacterium]